MGGREEGHLLPEAPAAASSSSSSSSSSSAAAAASAASPASTHLLPGSSASAASSASTHLLPGSSSSSSSSSSTATATATAIATATATAPWTPAMEIHSDKVPEEVNRRRETGDAKSPGAEEDASSNGDGGQGDVKQAGMEEEGGGGEEEEARDDDAQEAAKKALPSRERIWAGLNRPPPIAEDPQINPFSDPRPPIITPYSAISLLRFIFCVPLLALRLLLLLLLLFLAYLLVKLILLGVSDPLSKPFGRIRRSFLWPVRVIVRALLFLVFGYYFIPVKGSCAPRQAAPIIVCNHMSFVEPLFIFFAHMPVLVSAKENAELPIVGVFLQALQIIPVDRVSPNSRHDAASQIKKRAMDNRWPHIGIFPEGTTTNGSVLINFKTGAFAPGLPVQPMVVRYRNVNPAWLNSGPYPVLLHLMIQPINFMEVEYLPVAVPRRHEIEHPRIFANRVRRTMAQALNVKFTDHTLLDAKLALEAAKLLEPPELTLAEFGIMEKLFHLDYATAKSCLEKFSAMDTTHSGYLRIDQFLDALSLPLTPITREVFQLFDTSDKGFINFREFVAGIAFLSKETSFFGTMEAAFDACDIDRDGLLSLSEVERSLKTILPEMESSTVLKLFNMVDTGRDGVISWDEFSAYLKNNPEYLAVFMAARPDLLAENKQK